MPRVILVPVRGDVADEDVFAMALAIGGPRDAHFVVLHIRPDVVRDIASMAVGDGGMGLGADAMIGQMENEADAREQAAEQGWRAFLERNAITMADRPVENGPPVDGAAAGDGPAADKPLPGGTGMTSEWVSEIGVEADWIAAYGRTADLIVVGRGEGDQEPDVMLMEATLMDTGKPVLIAPRSSPDAPPLNGVAGIAWKDTPEAGAAVHAALPWLRAAEQVIIFIVLEDKEEQEKSHLRLARMLRWHNPRVTIHAARDDGRGAVNMLLDAVSKAGCGLLVMGGYGHGALRQAVFGGFTRAVLEAAALPVLMAH